MSTFDRIIVGAGSAGCVFANSDLFENTVIAPVCEPSVNGPLGSKAAIPDRRLEYNTELAAKP
jgi:hypothetical protein